MHIAPLDFYPLAHLAQGRQYQTEMPDLFNRAIITVWAMGTASVSGPLSSVIAIGNLNPVRVGLLAGLCDSLDRY